MRCRLNGLRMSGHRTHVAGPEAVHCTSNTVPNVTAHTVCTSTVRSKKTGASGIWRWIYRGTINTGDRTWRLFMAEPPSEYESLPWFLQLFHWPIQNFCFQNFLYKMSNLMLFESTLLEINGCLLHKNYNNLYYYNNTLLIFKWL